ncbi:MAG: polyprenyl synthetase family protein [Flavobacteriales bacterium]
MEKTLDYYLSTFETYLKANQFTKEPKHLYEPIDYIMALGGKRIRPVMALVFAEAYGSQSQSALPLAFAIEIFHNFTLVHDDIMDEAPLRRGSQTVHHKWDVNTAILSGDSMLILAYQELLKLETQDLKPLMTLFSNTAQWVCEGQQLDMDYETKTEVALSDYLEMIRLKTAVLLSSSMQLGAMFSGADAKELSLIESYGTSIGLAFQLRDDYLDVFGNEEIGKQQAGDILSNKKTALYLLALEQANADDKAKLLKLYANEAERGVEKVALVTEMFNKYDIKTQIQAKLETLFSEANSKVELMSINEAFKSLLLALNSKIIHRSS